MCHCKEDPGLYGYINQGCLSVDNMDDKEEMRLVDVRIFFLGFLPSTTYHQATFFNLHLCPIITHRQWLNRTFYVLFSNWFLQIHRKLSLCWDLMVKRKKTQATESLLPYYILERWGSSREENRLSPMAWLVGVYCYYLTLLFNFDK